MGSLCSEVVWRPWAGQGLEEKLCGLQPERDSGKTGCGREGRNDWVFEQLLQAHAEQQWLMQEWKRTVMSTTAGHVLSTF